MSAYPHQPAANPHGGSHGADDVKLHRDNQPTSLWDGAFGEAWELVKQRPVETLLLSFLWLMFNGGGSFNLPSGGGSSSSSGGSETTTDWSQTQDIGGSLFDLAGDLFARISMLEMGLIGAVIAIVITFAIVGLVLGTLVRGGATIFWLRLVRGQDASLGHTPKVISFFVPLLFATIAAGLLSMLGLLAFIVGAVVIAIGLSWVNQVVVDKNMGWWQALRASWKLTDGYKFDLFIFGILCGLLNIVGVLMCCVGLILTNAITMGATVIVYHRVAEPGNAYLDEGESPDRIIGGYDVDAPVSEEW